MLKEKVFAKNENNKLTFELYFDNYLTKSYFFPAMSFKSD